MLKVFRAGKHIDSRGVEREFTEQDVQDIADSYDPKNYHAPIFEGHDELKNDNKGLISWAKKLGSDLWLGAEKVANQFKEKVNSGRLPALSVKLYHPNDPNNPKPGKWGLRHLAFVQIPAIKGLGSPSFSEGNEFDVVIEFSEPVQFMDSGWMVMLARNLREYFLENGGSDVADKIVPSWMLESLMSESINEKFENQKQGEDMAYTEQQIKDFEVREAALLAREAETANIQQQTLEASFSEFLNSSKVVAKVPVAEKPYLLATMKALGTTNDKVEFAEGESMTPLDAFKKSILSRPDLVTFGEFATEDKAADPVNPDPNLQAQREVELAKEYQFSESQKGRNVLWLDAVKHVQRGKK